MTQSTEQSLLFVNARIVLDKQLIERGALLVQSGLIARIFADEPARAIAGAVAYDLAGATLFPGFIDVHIHGAVGIDMMTAAASDLNRISEFLASHGVTGWLPTLVPAPAADYARSIRAIAEAMKLNGGARILGVHYEGPFVNSAQCGALRSEFFRSFSGASDLDELARIDQPAAKHMITVAPEIEGGVELVQELNRRGWLVSLGHTRASFDLLDQAFEAGAHHMTHFMNAMTPLHHRSPGPVGWGLAHDDVSCDIIADGIHLESHILRLLLKLKGADRLSLISDAIAAAGMGDGAYEIWGETITVKDGRTSNPRGAIAGSVITMLDAVRTMQSLGASQVDVAKMAATNPARLLGVDHECGLIAEGKRADLVALDSDGRVVLTMVGGAILFDDRKSDD